MINKNSPIGIFDSGVGGLTVLNEICKILPTENIIYLGDTARVPYGIRSPETVTRYSFECTEFLLNQNIKLLVVACNTVSAISLPEIQKRVSIPVIGVIEPGARAAVISTKNKRVAVIGTEATIRSSSYTKAIKAINKDIDVFGLPCPLFVPLVEEGWTDGVIAELIAEKYLKDIIALKVDTLVLGCTHYPLLKGVIRKIMSDVYLVDSAIETAKIVKDVLQTKNIESEIYLDYPHFDKEKHKGQRRFYVTDSPEKFIKIGERFLEDKIENIEKITL